MRTIWRSMRQTKAIKGKQLHVEETYWSTNQAARSQGTVRCIEPFTSGSTTSFYCTRIEEVGAQPVWLVLLPSLQPFRRQSAMQNSQQTRRATFSTTNICTQHWSREKKEGKGCVEEAFHQVANCLSLEWNRNGQQICSKAARGLKLAYFSSMKA